MSLRKKLLLLLVALAVAAAVSLRWMGSPPGVHLALDRGSKSAPASIPAPEIALPDLNGRTVTLRDYRGKVVLLDFWATWCTPCRSEIPRFVAWQKQFGPEHFQVIGISMDDSDKPVRPFVHEMQIDYPVAMGDADLADRFGGVLGLPVNFIIAPDGSVAYRHDGEVDVSILEREIRDLLPR